MTPPCESSQAPQKSSRPPLKPLPTRWEKHFLNIALCCARMSKDPNTSVGAIIVGPDKEIRTTGFNGLPRGIDDTNERLQDKVKKLRIIVHAEMNAIMNAARVGIPVKGCTMYVACTDDSGSVWGGPPCTRCTVELIQSGISAVVAYQIKQHSSWLEDLTFARELLREGGVDFKEVRYRPGDGAQPWR